MSIGAVGRGALGLGVADNNVNFLINVPSITFILSSVPPQIISTLNIDVPFITFNLSSTPPVVTSGPVIIVPPKTFTLSSIPPEILGSDTVITPSKTFILSSTPPQLLDGTVILVPTKIFNLSGNSPDILLNSKLLERTVTVACTDQVFIILLTIDHQSLASPVLVSNDPTQLLPSAQVRGTISNGLEYIYLPFEFIFPNQEDGASPVSRLTIDNISREIATIVDSLTSSPSFKVEIVLSSTPDIVELTLADFALNKVKWDVLQLSADISVENFEQEPFPSGRFNPSGFPGLFAN